MNCDWVLESHGSQYFLIFHCLYYVTLNGSKEFFLYQGSLQALTIKASTNYKTTSMKNKPKNVDKTRHRTYVRYNYLE